MVESIYYLTYQDFPSRKANTIQTISTVSQFSRNGLNVKLFFPLRSKNSNDNINDLQTFYGFQESFDIKVLNITILSKNINFLTGRSFLFHTSLGH
ncbi:MAG: hypothetical protein CM15mP11_09960 [Gammaproteobacteria bacterium]|nr:MAG: hypothetical protein CM15mP11_09960 [Gammaproteobacteria bacterium]